MFYYKFNASNTYVTFLGLSYIIGIEGVSYNIDREGLS